ncbi:hypothetical protein HUJ05_001735, partial [Dendroctonus ponderosae]
MELFLGGFSLQNIVEILKQPIDSWDALVIHIISLKFDSVTRKEWETEYSKPNMSDLKVFTAFLQEKSRLLETLSMNNPSNLPIVLYVHFETKNIREKGWCLNCLRTNHRTEQCRFSPCRKCSKKHNTLLHNNTFFQEQSSNNASMSYPQAAINDNQSSRAQSVSNDNKLNSDFTYSYHCYYGTPRVLLSTAIVDVLDSDGNMHSCRVMLDSGSESSFITEQMFNKLNLCTTSTNISVSGICLVTSKVALDTSGLKIPPNVILADPSIDQPNSIDILIGIDKFWDLLSTGQIKLVSCNPNTSETLDVTLTKFWELEEKFLSRPLSIEDQRCEESFLKTTTQRPDGHFVVQLPFRHSESYLGHSKKIAIKRFLNLERKLNRNPLLKSDYSKFLEEYEALGHMISEKGWCLNCLRTNHRTEQCRFSPCRKCSKKHNTLLHNNTFFQEQSSNNASMSYPQAAINDNQSSRAQSVSNDNKLNSDFTYSYHCYYGTPRVLLSTAIVDVLDSDGNMHSCRVMLDSGSESSFITEQMFNKLNLCTTSTNISVSGICLVTSKVALDTSGLKIPPNVILADPSIDQPNSIDILIGIDKFWDLLSTGQIKLGKNLTVIQKTHLGWVISGPITTHCNSFKVSCNPNTSETLDVTLTKFWELEEKFLSRPLSIEDQRCEESFLKTTTQRPDGHFVNIFEDWQNFHHSRLAYRILQASLGAELKSEREKGALNWRLTKESRHHLSFCAQVLYFPTCCSLRFFAAGRSDVKNAVGEVMNWATGKYSNFLDRYSCHWVQSFVVVEINSISPLSWRLDDVKNVEFPPSKGCLSLAAVTLASSGLGNLPFLCVEIGLGSPGKQQRPRCKEGETSFVGALGSGK